MKAIDALRDITVGDVDDAPAIPHETIHTPVHAPEMGDRILDAFARAPLPLQVTALALVFALFVGLLAANMLLIRGAVRRAAKAKAASAQRDDKAKAEAAKQRAMRLTYVIGVFASAVSASYTLYVFRDQLGHNPAIWLAFASIAVLFELIVIMLAANALADALDKGVMAPEGRLLMLVTLAIATVTYHKQEVSGLKPLAIIPLAAGLSYYVTLRRAIAGYWAKRPAGAPGAPVTERRAGLVTVLWNRALVALRLAERSDVTLSEQDKNRRVARFVWKAYKAQNASFAWQRWLANLGLDRALISLQERYGNEVYQQALVQIAALSQARAKMAAAATAEVTAWDVEILPPATTAATSITPARIITATATATLGATTTPELPSTTTTTTPAAITRGAATWAEVERIRQGWSSADLAARIASVDVAHEYAAAQGAEVAKTRVNVSEGLRTYCLVMHAAGHRDWNKQRMYRAVSGNEGRSALGGQVFRRIADELADDPQGPENAVEDFLADVADETQAGGSRA